MKEHVIKVYGDMNVKPPVRNPKQITAQATIKRINVDPKIEFLKQTIKRVDYLQNINDKVFFDIMFSLKSTNYDKNQTMLTDENYAEALLFIEEGSLEVSTKFEGNDFVIEKLFRGSAVNHRAFFMKDSMYVNVRTAKETKILSLSLDRMKEII